MSAGPVAPAAPRHEDPTPVDGRAAAEHQRPRWRRALLPGGIGAAVVACYLIGSGAALDFDSAQMVGASIRTPSLADALTSQAVFNNHPAFSLVEHLVVTVTGASSDAALRVAPALFAGLAIALLVASLRPTLGAWPAVCAGAVTAVNPMVVELSRGVRGYSLLLLAAVGATTTLAHLVSAPEGEPVRRRLHLTYVAWVAVGLGTHLYMAPIVLAHVAVVVTRRRLSHEWVQRWLLAGVLGGVFYVAIVDEMLASSGSGGRHVRPRFPLEVAEVVFGRGLAGVLLALLALAGAVCLRHRRDLAAATAVVGGAVAVTWLVVASAHLSARFHLFAVPAVAALVAVAVRRWPRLALVVAAAVALHLAVLVPGYGGDPTALPQAGRVLDRAEAAGLRGCVTSYSVRPMLAYSDVPVAVTSGAELDGCDVVVVPFPGLDRALADEARRRLPIERPLDGDPRHGMVFLADAAVAARVCLAARGICG